MQQSIKNCGGAGHVLQQFSPVFDWAIRRHHGRTRLVAPHDDLEQDFSTAARQNLNSHVVDDEQIRLEVLGQHAIVPIEGFVVQEVAHDIEDGSVQHEQPDSDPSILFGSLSW